MALRGWRWLFAVAMVLSLVLALLPGGQGEDWFENADKLRHAVAFMALYWMGWRAQFARPGHLLFGLLCFGVFIELAQSLTTWRTATVGDVVADLVGVTIGYLGLRRPAT